MPTKAPRTQQRVRTRVRSIQPRVNAVRKVSACHVAKTKTELAVPMATTLHTSQIGAYTSSDSADSDVGTGPPFRFAFSMCKRLCQLGQMKKHRACHCLIVSTTCTRLQSQYCNDHPRECRQLTQRRRQRPRDARRVRCVPRARRKVQIADKQTHMIINTASVKHQHQHQRN